MRSSAVWGGVRGGEGMKSILTSSLRLLQLRPSRKMVNAQLLSSIYSQIYQKFAAVVAEIRVIWRDALGGKWNRRCDWKSRQRL